MRFLVLSLLILSNGTAFGAMSAEHRQHQAVQLLVGSYGYAVGLLVADDRTVELGHSGLRIDREEEGQVNEALDRWSQSLFVHLKSFHGNSFQTNWGVSWEDSGFGDNPYHRSERSVVFLDAALGNQWSWRHLTLGVDWVGVGVPVFERVRIREDGSATDEGRKARLATREWQGVQVKWMTVYAGVVF